MIKVNELRYGNIFMRPSGNMVSVESIKKDGFDYTDIGTTGSGGWHSFRDGSYLSPVSLTPEILEKCGFENDHGFFKETFTSGEIILKEYGHGFKLCRDNGSTLYKVNLIFLHQLQNLFQILIGEELQVNL